MEQFKFILLIRIVVEHYMRQLLYDNFNSI